MDEKKLRDLAEPLCDKVIRAIKGGQLEEAIELVKQLTEESKRMHDVGFEFVWTLLTYIGRKCGDEAVGEALRFRHENKPQLSNVIAELKAEDRVEHIALAHRGHFSNITISEEEDRFIIKLDPCGTGGRMWRKELVDSPQNLHTIREAYEWTWGTENTPAYCAHCCVHEIMSMKGGSTAPPWITERPGNAVEPCYWFVYKKPELIPKTYLERVGTL
ncbi:MAG: hypothetical protein ACE5PO_09050 [Candidatus Bathyarchaeia archaeon]